MVSIRTRLALGVALVLAVAFASLGFVLVGSTRATLLDQADDRLVEVSAYALHTKGPPGNPGGYGDDGGFGGNGGYGGDGPYGGYGGDAGPGGDGECVDVAATAEESVYGENAPRSVGEFVFGPDGEAYMLSCTGYADDPDPIPRFPVFPSAEADALVGRIVTLPAVGGSFEYRVLVERDDEGNYVAVAAPLDEIDTAVARVVRTVTFGGVTVLVVAGLASWWLIRRGLRPVDRMVDTAAAIAGGDLSRRVAGGDPRTELGRLGVALNEMLGQIEQGVDERVRNEERLRRFVADAAHELRTPLTSVRGYAELYRQGALADAGDLTKAMGRIEAEGGRMARLVDDLLLLARLDRQLALECEPVDLGDVAREAVEDFAVVEPGHPVTTEIAGAAVVTGDAVRLRQVFDNLLANVRVHTPAGTAVRVSVRTDRGQAVVAVEDDGPGVAEADRARVFERFWRGDPSRVRKTGGTGLGLAIVASLVEAHAGTVELASGDGRGATFTVRIPVPDSPAGRAGESGVGPVGGVTRGDTATPRGSGVAERVVPA